MFEFLVFLSELQELFPASEVFRKGFKCGVIQKPICNQWGGTTVNQIGQRIGFINFEVRIDIEQDCKTEALSFFENHERNR